MTAFVISELKVFLLSASVFPRRLQVLKNVQNYSKAACKKPGDESDGKKDSKPVYITLYGTDGVPSTSILESALKLSKRRNLKLVKISDYDSIRQTPVYKLITSSEVLKDELDSKKSKNKSESGFKGEKILSLSDNIGPHDLDSKLKQILKWIEKKNSIRVTITGSSPNKLESVFKNMEAIIKPHGRILQKRSSEDNLKFQVIPLKETKKSDN